jgi:hypothetical protein
VTAVLDIVVLLVRGDAAVALGDRRVRAEELDDPFRRGILTVARATSQAELAWLRTTLDSLDLVGR